MGETGNGQIAGLGRAVEPMVVDTLGGRMQVCWDGSSQATPNGQLVFFAEFLRAAGVFDEWVRACPLEYRSGNAPGKRDVLGTLLLAILAGHRRYAHVTSLRGDGVAAQALGMDRVVSEDALRRALSRIEETASVAWLCPALMGSVQDALEQPGQSHEKLFTHNGLRMGVVNCCEEALTLGFVKSREWCGRRIRAVEFARRVWGPEGPACTRPGA